METKDKKKWRTKEDNGKEERKHKRGPWKRRKWQWNRSRKEAQKRTMEEKKMATKE